MINFDVVINENKAINNPNWSPIPDHPYRILITGGSGSVKTNAIQILTYHQSDIYKICLYAKDPYESKYQKLIEKRKDA